MSRLVAWGAGELGGRVARAWAGSGRPVLAITRTTARHAELTSWGIACLATTDPPPLLPGDRLLLALPGTAAQTAAVESLVAAGTSEVLGRAVLVSTTAYFALTAGTLDERTSPGDSADARAVAACEQGFAFALGQRGVVVRLGGLYRPGRGPYAVLARTGSCPLGPPNKTLALLHYHDAAQALLGALEHDAPAATYLAVTPPCPTRAEFYAAACAQLALPPPGFGPAIEDHPATYDVARLRRDLLPAASHPDWREALA